ncbi:MAG TPA: RES family NAD+ phosphorylase [Woeseiaceae bacterium]|nr:RES family NAD+ phosphorylase [Woeseiaceae bacterium]
MRLVESQEEVATLGLVDTLSEQRRLERLLEGSKPPLLGGTEHLHYLLAAPFRYPPLTYGSRFGTRQEPGLFYGSLGATALLSEAAYYRFVFWTGMSSPPPSGKLDTQHNVFTVDYRTQQGLRLYAPPFTEFAELLTSRDNYASTQQLGRDMRAAGIEGFEYQSARDAAGGVNVALYTPRSLASARPKHIASWLAETRAEAVTFSERGSSDVASFPIEQFLIAGTLPLPAL